MIQYFTNGLIKELIEQSRLMVDSTYYRLSQDRVEELTIIVNCVNNFISNKENIPIASNFVTGNNAVAINPGDFRESL